MSDASSTSSMCTSWTRSFWLASCPWLSSLRFCFSCQSLTRLLAMYWPLLWSTVLFSSVVFTYMFSAFLPALKLPLGFFWHDFFWLGWHRLLADRFDETAVFLSTLGVVWVALDGTLLCTLGGSLDYEAVLPPLLVWNFDTRFGLSCLWFPDKFECESEAFASMRRSTGDLDLDWFIFEMLFGSVVCTLDFGVASWPGFLEEGRDRLLLFLWGLRTVFSFIGFSLLFWFNVSWDLMFFLLFSIFPIGLFCYLLWS